MWRKKKRQNHGAVPYCIASTSLHGFPWLWKHHCAWWQLQNWKMQQESRILTCRQASRTIRQSIFLILPGFHSLLQECTSSTDPMSDLSAYVNVSFQRVTVHFMSNALACAGNWAMRLMDYHLPGWIPGIPVLLKCPQTPVLKQYLEMYSKLIRTIHLHIVYWQDVRWVSY